MASTPSSPVMHTQAQEVFDIGSEERERIVRVQQSVTTVASSSSSHSELRRAFNRSEDQHISSMLYGGHEQSRHVSQSTAASTSYLDSHDELHLPLVEKSDGRESPGAESDIKPAFDTGLEGEHQSPGKLSGAQKALNTGSEKGESVVDYQQSEIGSRIGIEEDIPDEYVTGIKTTLVLAAITIVYFLVMLDNTILATAIPHITSEFHSLLDVGWYGSAYQLSCASLQPFGGKIYSRLNSKWSFISYLVLFEAGSAICGAASSSTMLIIGRAIAGMGGSGLLNGALIILNSCVPPHRQPGLVGILMGIGQLGIAFGPLIGGAFTEYVTWRWCFYVNLPIGGVVALGLVFLHIPDHIAKPRIREVFRHAFMDFDVPGFLIFAPAAIMLFLALQYGGHQYAWGSSHVIGLFCGSGAAFIVWLTWDWYRGDSAMVPFSMMGMRVVWASCVAAFFLGGTVFVTGYYLPIYFQAVLGASPFSSGVDILPNILSQMVFGIVSGGLVQRIGYYTPFLLIGAAFNAIGCGLLSLLTPFTPTGHWIGFQIIMGTGRGFAMAIPFLAIQNNLRKDMIPAAMSILVFLQNFGSAVMIELAQTILTNSLVDLVPKNAPGVDPQLVISVGTTATAIEQLVGPDQLQGVLWAYSQSLQRIWYFVAAIGTPAFFVAWCLGWVNIRKKAEELESSGSAGTLEM
ncbi:MFS general substrate transporter [Hypoxylon sp. NC1633]|nr:MFS general substrate transporter [Hypoxylon sp. NC1633]